MFKINQSQYIERWDSLPVVLREALFSPEKGELIWRVGEEHHLKDEQIGKISGICGNIVMGFLHPDDLAKEIKTDLGLDERLAGAIAREIDKKVFSGIRSEIDKVYAPPAPVVSDIVETPAAPEAETQPLEVKPPISEEVISLETFEKTSPASEIKREEEPAPAPLSEAAPEAAVAPEAAAEKEATPIILHQESEISPITESPKAFSLSRFFDFLKKKETLPAEEAPRVEIETGDEGEIGGEESPAKVVHYTEAEHKEAESPKIKPPESEEPPKQEELNNVLPAETSTETKNKADEIIDLKTFEKK